MRIHTYCLLLSFVLYSSTLHAQASNEYEISFENAVHHEAAVKATFTNLKDEVLEVRMSRSSPGRYALHEFAKNVYNVSAVDSKGKALSISRPNPYQWNVSGHDGTVTFSYTLFGDRGDGTYLQIDETHAHLNMPATFAFARHLEYRPIKVKFKLREDLKWKVATQLKHVEGNLYYAPHLQYFMDSPTEISNFTLREFDEESGGKRYKFRVAIHHTGTEAAAGRYTESVKKLVRQEKAAMGELPAYDFGTYTFIACYMPQSSGDGMEHRNSTFLTGAFLLDNPEGMASAIGTVSHELFHCWNVERIRPDALEPFNFEEANMSGELWFAEGFTSYYTDLFLCRAGIITQKEYIEELHWGLNGVLNSPAKSFFSPVGMSNYAPFADAATAIDPRNGGNTFISYYTYGEVLGLALDLSLRNFNTTASLDEYMRLVWSKYGKTELPYNLHDLQSTLTEYTNAEFANNFFESYIYKSGMPDFDGLLNSVGVVLEKASAGKAYLGATLRKTDAGVTIGAYTRIGTPAYKAGLESGDIITSIEGKAVTDPDAFTASLDLYKPGQEVMITYKRLGQERMTRVVLEENPTLRTRLYEDAGFKLEGDKSKRRAAWLSAK
jgi:predicted metalloprotease with PDZ domain